MTGFTPDTEGLGAVLGAVPEVVLVLDLDGHIQYINQGTDELDPEDIVGIHADDLMDPESQEVFDAALTATVETGEPQEYEVRVTLPDGHDGWFRTRMSPFPEVGGMTGVLLISEDVTELKRQAREVARLRRLLPICAWCDRIRTDEGDWATIERYMEREEGTKVSHGICPDCLQHQTEGDDGNGAGNAA